MTRYRPLDTLDPYTTRMLTRDAPGVDAAHCGDSEAAVRARWERRCEVVQCGAVGVGLFVWFGLLVFW